MQNQLVQRLAGIGVFILVIVALNIGSFVLGCGTIWY